MSVEYLFFLLRLKRKSLKDVFPWLLSMRKALAQNPNLLRTLIGLSFTLVFVLSYAVYGATIDTEYYIYSTERNESSAELSLLHKEVSKDDGGDEWTTWLWQADVNRTNLTWINSSLSGAPAGSILKVINTAGWYSHELLGETTDLSFNCAIECEKKTSHSKTAEEGSAMVIGLIHTDPARRDGGTVRADSEAEALEMVDEILNRSYSEGVWQIQVVAPGNHSIEPQIELLHVNEQFVSMEPFSLDTATEMMWSLAAVIGCFIIVLVPLMTMFIISRMQEKGEVEISLSDSEE